MPQLPWSKFHKQIAVTKLRSQVSKGLGGFLSRNSKPNLGFDRYRAWRASQATNY